MAGGERNTGALGLVNSLRAALGNSLKCQYAVHSRVWEDAYQALKEDALSGATTARRFSFRGDGLVRFDCYAADPEHI